MSPKRKRAGTAAKSLTLTYAQLEFLDGLDNASAWVREAIDQALKVKTGELVIVKLDKSHRSRMARASWLEAPWSNILGQVFDAEEAYEKAREEDKAKGDTGQATMEKFPMAGWEISRLFDKMLEKPRKPRP